MKLRAELLAVETIEEAAPYRCWGPGLVLASLASWAMVIEAVRLVAAAL